VQGRNYSPPELSGIVLQRLKAARRRLSGRINAPTPSSPYLPTVTTPSDRQQKTPEK
jgi:hypothetical protein